MIRLVNPRDGSPTTWVHESRLEEYLAAGFKLAAPPKPEHPLIVDEPAKKKQTKKKG